MQQSESELETLGTSTLTHTKTLNGRNANMSISRLRRRNYLKAFPNLKEKSPNATSKTNTGKTNAII
jgi:hypothetical protein